MPPRTPRPQPTDLLAAGAQALGLRLAPAHLHAFSIYLDELARWSTRMNLTALRTPAEVIREGFLDSLSCLPLLGQARSVIDLGSGAGFPALPLAVLRPAVMFTLIEAIRKKATFLRHIARILELPHVRVLQTRAETLAGNATHQAAYDLAMARAIAPLPEQARLVRPFLGEEGVFVAQVTAGPPVDNALRALTESGWTVVRAIPGLDGHRSILALRPR